jgi:hypothetical protein
MIANMEQAVKNLTVVSFDKFTQVIHMYTVLVISIWYELCISIWYEMFLKKS